MPLRVSALALVLGVSAWSRSAHALECGDKVQVERATAAAHAAFGAERYEEAAEKYASVHACTKDPSLLFNLAKADAHLGRWIEAKGAMTQFLASAQRVSPEVEAAAKEDLAAISEHVGTVTVRAPVAGATVTIDGEPAGTAPLGPIERVAGPLRVEVSAPAHVTYARDFTLAGGASLEIEASLPEATAKKPPPPVWMWIGYGVAAAGGIVGAITGGLSIARVDEVRALCTGDLCPKSTEPDRNAANDLANASNVSLAIGGAGAILGIVGTVVFATSGPSTEAHASIRVGPTGVVVSGVF